MENVIILFIVAGITGSIIRFLIHAKKRGQACIGCPHAKQCASKCSGGCSCHGAS